MTQAEPLVAFTVAGEPASKARPIFTTRGGKPRAITPAETVAAEGKVAWSFRLAVRKHDTAGPFGVMVLFHLGNRRRRDVDNMLKLVLDALNGVAWDDDHQVLEVTARKVQATAETARTEIVIYRPGDHAAVAG